MVLIKQEKRKYANPTTAVVADLLMNVRYVFVLRSVSLMRLKNVKQKAKGKKKERKTARQVDNNKSTVCMLHLKQII